MHHATRTRHFNLDGFNKSADVPETPGIWMTISATVFLLVSMKSNVAGNGGSELDVSGLSGAEADIRQYLEDALEGFKSALFRTSIEHKHRRSRREIYYTEFNQSQASAFEVQVASIVPYQRIPSSRPVELEPFAAGSTNYLAVVNYQNVTGNYATRSEIYMLNRTTWEFNVLQQFQTSGATDFEFADFGFDKYAIFLENIGANVLGQISKERWFQTNQLLPNENPDAPFFFETRVKAQGGTRIKVFEHVLSQYYLTANSYSQFDGGYHVKSTLHARTRLGFELVQTFDTKGASDVEAMVINDQWFVVFANYRDNYEKVDIYSNIYRETTEAERAENPSAGMFKLHQQILTHGARDVQLFTYDGYYYLAVANEYTLITSDNPGGVPGSMKNYEIDSVIYWWTGKLFVEWQRIPTQGAVRINYLGLNSTNEPILIVSNSKTQAVIYTFDPLRGIFKPTRIQGLAPFPDRTEIIPDVRSVMTFTLPDYPEEDCYFFAVANFNETARSGYNLFKVKFSLEPTESLAKTVPEIIREVLNTTKLLLQEVSDSIQSIANQTQNILTKSSNQTITGFVTMDEVVVTDKISAANLIYTNSVDINPIADAQAKTVALQRQLAEQEAKLRELFSTLDGFVKLNETANVTGTKIFLGGLAVNGDLIAKNNVAVRGTLNNINITDVDNRVWKKTADQTFTGQYTFVGPVHINGNVTLNGLVNGIKIDDKIMTLSGDQLLTSAKTFADEVTMLSNASLVNFTLNGYNVPGDFLLRNGNQTVTGRKSFRHVTFESQITVAGLVDSVNLTLFNNTKLTTDTDQLLFNNVVFEKGFSSDNDVKVGGLVDGVNLTTLLDDIWLNNTSVNITGKKVFSSINVLGSARVEGMLNGEQLENFATLDTDQRLTGNLTFLEDVHISGSLTTSSTINGMDISTDAVTTYGDQTITGKKYFSTVEVHAELLVQGSVNNVNFTEWQSQAVLRGTDRNITGSKTFASGVNIEERFIVNELDGINMHTLKDGIVSLTSDGPLPSNLEFDNVIVDDDVRVKGLVNGYKIPNAFILLNTSQNITGRKTFAGAVELQKNLSFSSGAYLNGESLSYFYNDVVKINTNNNITGETIVEDFLIFGNVTVKGKIAGVDILTDFITTNTDQNISSTGLTFKNDVLFEDNVDAYVVNVNTTVNNIDISAMESEAVYKDRNQTLSSKAFVGDVFANQSLLVGRSINAINVSDLMDNTMRLNEPQTITGAMNFSGGAYFQDSLQSPGTVQGVNLTKLYLDWLSNRYQRELGDVIFGSDLIVIGNLTVVGLINGVDLSNFVKNAAKVANESVRLDSATFTRGLNVRNLTVYGLFGGVNTSAVMLTHGDQNITGFYVFGDVAAANVSIGGFINGLDLTDFSESVVKLNESAVLTGRTTFKTLSVYGDILINGTVNGIDISEFDAEAVHLTGNETIYGIKSFIAPLTRVGNASILAMVNNVDVALLLNDSLMKLGDQKVCQKKTFTSETGVKVLNDTMVNALNASMFVNGINISQLARDAVRLGTFQELSGFYRFDDVTVEGAVNVNGTVNAVRLPNDVLRTFDDQIVNGTKTFRNLTVRRDLNVKGFVDGVDLAELNATRITLNTIQRTSAGLVLLDKVIFDSSLNLTGKATVNGIDLSAELVSTASNTFIPGQPKFKSFKVASDLSVEGDVNGVDVGNMAGASIRISSDTNQVLKGYTTFTRDLEIIGNLEVSGSVNNISLAMVANYSKDVSIRVDNTLKIYEQQTDLMWPQCYALVQAAVTGVAIVGIEKLSVVSLASSELGLMDSTIVGDVIYVSIGRMDGADCGDAYILRCSSTMSCSIQQTVMTRAARLEFFTFNNMSALYVPHWASNTSVADICKATPEIYVLSSGGSYELYQPPNPNVLQKRRRRDANEKSSSKSDDALAAAVTKGNGLKRGVAFASYQRALDDAVGDENAAIKSDQPLSAAYFKKVKTFEVDGKNLVALSGKEKNSDVIEILLPDTSTNGSAKVQQKLVTKNVRSIQVDTLKNNTILSVAEGGVGAAKGAIKMYAQSKSTGKFELAQSLPEVDATTMSINTANTVSVLSYASPTRGLGFCTYRGNSGFGDCKDVRVTNTEQMNSVSTSAGAYTLAISDNRLTIYQTKFEGNAEEFSPP